MATLFHRERGMKAELSWGGRWKGDGIHPTRLVVVILILTSMFCAAACDSPAFASSCRQIGLCEEDPKPAELLDLLCDHSVGSSCTTKTLEQTTDRVVQHISERPGSRMRVWMLGATVEKTVVVVEHAIPAAKGGSAKSQRAQAARVAATAREVLLTGIAPAFESPPVRRSPIAEAIAKVALADASGLYRRVIVITDAREVSTLGDFECRALPTNAQFAALLQRMNVLSTGQLAGIDILFAHVAGQSVPGRGCPVSVDRELRIKALWTTALRAAGASRVHISSGPPELLVDANDGPLNHPNGAAR